MDRISDGEQKKSRVRARGMKLSPSGIDLCQPCQQGVKRVSESCQMKRRAQISKICEEDLAGLRT